MPGPRPIVPEDLARYYADVAIGYNRRLPAIEQEQRDARAFLEALNRSISNLTIRLEDIARAVKAAPRSTVSGQMPAVTALSVPPVPLEQHLKGTATMTGSQILIPVEELRKLEAEIREQQAEERGAKEALAEADAAAERAERKEKAFREKVMVVVGVGVPFTSGLTWAVIQLISYLSGVHH